MHHGSNLFHIVVLLCELMLLLLVVVVSAAAIVILVKILHASVGAHPMPRLRFVLSARLFKIAANILSTQVVLTLLLHLVSLAAARLLVLAGAALRVSTLLFDDELLA